MPTIAELNVRIGSDIRGLQQGLKRAESQLAKSNATLGGLAAQLTNTLTISFAALSGGALKAFSDIEKLEKGLESQMGSAEAARQELENIREAAKAPGLGFEQFVKGSLQLQAVGDNADQARKTISVFGNALALAGKGAAELDGVVTALTQIKAKGVVSAEEINQIAERLPQIRTAMKDAFGTADTEKIQKLGITANEFIDGITASLQKLPKASTSFSNDVSNALDNITQGAARLGEKINSSLRIGERFSALSEWVLGAADAFGNLDENTQRWAIGIAVAAAALGPAIRAGNAMVQVGGAMINAWTRLNIVFKEWLVLSANPEGKTGLISWWKGLNGVMKANVIGIAIGLVLALGAAFLALRDNSSAAEKAQRSVNDVLKNAEASVAGQKAEVNGLVEAYKREGATLDEKKGILNELKKISPEYFGGLKAGKGDLEALTKATAAYSKELILNSQITAAKSALDRVSSQRLNIKETADPSLLQSVGNALLAFGNGGAFAANQINTLGKNIVEQTKALDAEEKALVDLINSLSAQSLALKQSSDDVEDNSDATDTAAKMAEKYLDVLNDIEATVNKAKVFGEDEDIVKVDALKKAIEELIEAGFKPASKEVQDLKKQWDDLTKDPPKIPVVNLPSLPVPGFVTSQAPKPALPPVPIPDVEQAEEAAVVYENLSESFLKFAESVGLGSSALAGLNTGMETLAESVGPAFEELAGSIIGVSGAYTRLGASALAAASQIMKAALAATLAKAIKDSFEKSGHPLIGIALAGVAVGAVNALFGKIQDSVSKTPKFAMGTQNAPGGLALVGEQGPELVNLPKGSRVYPNPATNQMLNGMGSNVNVSGEFRVQGTDLVLVLERANAKNNRYR